MLPFSSSSIGLVARNLLITSTRGSKPRNYKMAFDSLVPEAPSVQGALSKIPGIKKVAVTATGVDVTVKSDGVWPSVRFAIERNLYTTFDPDTPHTPAELHKAISSLMETGERSPTNISKAAKILIRAAINPYLARDGGSCSYKKHEFTANGLVVYIALHGNCSGCSKSMTTMNEFVTKEFKKYIPGLYMVRHTDE